MNAVQPFSMDYGPFYTYENFMKTRDILVNVFPFPVILNENSFHKKNLKGHVNAHLGMQLGGVLSTSHDEKSFIGTGFTLLDEWWTTPVRLTFSVILP